jgi:uncharacterized tellurite resistance protein B-like protein
VDENQKQHKEECSMGSWAELDANYGRLTPAIAFMVSLTHMAGADGVYLEEEEGSLAAFLPRHGLGAMSYDELLDRTEDYLQTTSFAEFLAEAPPILNQEQKLCILLNMLDSSLADGVEAPEETDVFCQFLQAFQISQEQIAPLIQAIRIKHNLSVFTQ